MSTLSREQHAPSDQGRLTTYVRFSDLVAANIVHNWPTLLRLIDTQGFPCGVMIGRNVRAWPLAEVQAWLAARPTARKIVVRKRQIHEEASA